MKKKKNQDIQEQSSFIFNVNLSESHDVYNVVQQRVSFAAVVFLQNHLGQSTIYLQEFRI